MQTGLSADAELSLFYYNDAQTNQCLIMSHEHPQKFQGALAAKSLADHTVFLDWLNPNASSIWKAGLKDLYS